MNNVMFAIILFVSVTATATVFSYGYVTDYVNDNDLIDIYETDECWMSFYDEHGNGFKVRLYNITHPTQKSYPKTDCQRLREICTQHTPGLTENNYIEINGINYTYRMSNIPCNWVEIEQLCMCEPYRWRDDVTVETASLRV